MELISLHDGRPGLRTLLQIQARESASDIGDNSCNSCLDFISSTATLDRYHEIIDPAGWRLDSYRRNPVFQNAHNYGDILFTLGKALITEVRSLPFATPHSPPATVLFQRIQFATDVNPIARIAYGLYKGSFLNAVSVGFIPLRWEDADGPQQTPREAPQQLSTLSSQPSTQQFRRKYLEQELLEVSAVAIPANPDALALGVKTGAITRSDLADTLDLLRSLTVDYVSWRPPATLAATAPKRQGSCDLQPGTCNSQLIAFARELHRILRHA